jgi:poly(A) polymerase
MKLEDGPFKSIRNILLANKKDYGEIYLIGGYVRDFLLHKQNNDLDFSVTKNAANAARRIADFFNGDFYLLDHQRETARALVNINDNPMTIDIALISGKNIKEDLPKRDFTINALAIDITDLEKVIDLLDGRTDLINHELKPCSENSFINDPIRTLRAIRFIQSLSLDFDDHVKQLIITASKDLKRISNERIRDEICHIFDLSDIKKSLDLLWEFDLFKQLFPDLIPLQRIPPAFPHVSDAFTHTLQVVELTHIFIKDIFIGSQRTHENKLINESLEKIGKYKYELRNYFDNLTDRKIPFSILMIFAALYHDSGKSIIMPVKDGEKLIFKNHAEISANIAFGRLKSFAFSNEEIQFVKLIILHHMDEELKIIGDELEFRKNIYRFFRDAGYCGILVGFLHLADLIATYGKSMPAKGWATALKSVDRLFDAWFHQYEEIVAPPRLLNGDDLIDKFGIKPGPQLGKILEQIREEQAAGKILERNAALEYAVKLIRGFG